MESPAIARAPAMLLERALGELDPDVDPGRYSELLVRLSRAQWSLNRGAEAVETAERALSMVPPDEVSAERASLLAWTARVRYLRGRYREALKEGREALATAVAAGDRRSESEVLNTLGMAGIVTRVRRRGRHVACGVRSRSRGRTTTSTGSERRTRTWPTP